MLEVKRAGCDCCNLTSPSQSSAVPPYYLHSSSAFFRDTQGRAVLLRGLNFSDASKAPLGQPSHQLEDFWESAESGGKSFVGQPLNLDNGSADVHLRRLRLWGFNCFRWVFTWEALEHQGPGKYDHAYMDYLVEVLRKCKEYGFKVYMDPHQDVCSRFTGGSGMPYWVLPACGIDHRGLTPTQAAFIHCEWPSSDAPDPASFPDMIWATNYVRLAASTISALFFAGHDVAPRCKIDGMPISHWLQDHFFAAVRELAVKIRDAGDLLDETVIGWDSLNEPNKTYIGLQDVQHLPEEWKLRQGPMPSPIEGMRLGMGRAQTVPNYVFTSLGPKKSGTATVDPKGATIWLTPEEDAVRGGNKWGWKRDADWPLGQCVWAAHGVWDPTTGDVLRPDYFNTFRNNNTEKIDFIPQYWLPFWRKYAATIRSIHAEAILFIQPPVFEPAPHELSEEHDLKGRVAASPHFYDGLTLITKHWNWFNADAVGLLRGKYAGLPFALRFGERAVRKCMRDQLGYLKQDTADVLGKYPTIIGEIGIPFDLDNKKAYYGDKKGKGKGDYSAQTNALDASLNAADGDNVLNYSLWTYCPESTHQWSDGWNGEDLSIWNVDDVPAPRDDDAADLYSYGASPPSVGSTLRPSRPSTARGDGLDVDDADGAKTSANVSKEKISLSNFTVATTRVAPETDVASSLARLFAGARSAEAFSRPYPIASTGWPASINFDIKSSEFRYEMDVEADDVASSNGSSGSATEIYVPLVHYAEDDVLAGALGRSDASDESRQLAHAHAPKSQGQVSRNDTLASINIDNVTTAAASKKTSTSPTATPTQLLSDDRLPPLALEVSVSAGEWDVSGQVLSWKLPRGATGRHHIIIKRRGGSIAALAGPSADESWCSSCTIL